MSEFKFACPVCGQHITADSTASGSQLECPTCFQKIIVPQAPASPDSKFILSATQVGKPRPLPSGTGADSLLGQPLSRSKSTLAGIAFVLVALAAAAGVIVFRKQIFKPTAEPVRKKAPTVQEVKGTLNSAPPDLSNTNWTLELAKVTFPEQTAAGRIHGTNFICERATVEGRTLGLRQGKGWPPPLGLALVLPARPVEELSGRSVGLAPDQVAAGFRVVLRWKDDQNQNVKLDVNTGFALKLAFDHPTNGVLPGRIYICLQDEAKSYVAGSFTAEIRKPSPPKPHAPKAVNPPKTPK